MVRVLQISAWSLFVILFLGGIMQLMLGNPSIVLGGWVASYVILIFLLSVSKCLELLQDIHAQVSKSSKEHN